MDTNRKSDSDAALDDYEANYHHITDKQIITDDQFRAELGEALAKWPTPEEEAAADAHHARTRQAYLDSRRNRRPAGGTNT